MIKMIRFLAATIFFLSFCIIPAFAWDGNDSTMYWMVNGSGNSVDDGPNDVYTFLGFDYSDAEIGARIACYDKSGNLVKYLNPILPDESGGSYIDWEFNDQYIGTRDDLSTATRWSQAYYGSDDYAERLFQMQIGSYDEDYNFSPMLWTRGELVDGKHWYDWGTLAPGGSEWTPTQFYTINPVVPSIPEPSSGLLMLVGGSMLVLFKRPKTFA